MSNDRIIIDSLNRKFRIPSPTNLSEAPNDIRIARKSTPWRIYFNMLGTVLPAFFLLYTSLFMMIGIINLDPFMTLTGSICTLPLMVILFRLHRPKLIHVKLALPDDEGKYLHPLPNGGSLQTNVKTNFTRFIIRDDSVLDIPPSKQLWAFFISVISIGIIISFIFFSEFSQELGIILFIIVAIPLWLIGFSLPVLAWWGTSTQFLGLPTRRRDAESWLLAGMAAAFPAFFFNSFAAPALIPEIFPQWANDLCILAFSAPFCEELFKGAAVAIFLPSIKGPKHGFQIGFTVGLGFALIENFQYIGMSLLGGPLGITLTILIRGIGSIPGHAVWTAITGTAIGWLAKDIEFKTKLEWYARNWAIDAVDIVEGLGIDVDGDGDLSGYDDARFDFDDMLSEAYSKSLETEKSWLLVDNYGVLMNQFDDTNLSKIDTFDLKNISVDNINKSNLPSNIFLPKSIFSALLLAMLGHSFWNGSSYLSEFLPEIFGLGPGYTALISITWSVILITSILVIAIRLLKEVKIIDVN